MKWLVLAGLIFSPDLAFALPAQVIIIRHAEKPDDEAAQHLSARGEERARALVKFFTQNEEVLRHGAPRVLFASKPTRRGNGQRPAETLAPLAAELHLPVQTPYDSDDYSKLAKTILRGRACKGKTVVVCWVHESIPELAAALGVKPEPPKWKDHVYDLAYVITFPEGRANLEWVPENVLPGDSARKRKKQGGAVE